MCATEVNVARKRKQFCRKANKRTYVRIARYFAHIIRIVHVRWSRVPRHLLSYTTMHTHPHACSFGFIDSHDMHAAGHI